MSRAESPQSIINALTSARDRSDAKALSAVNPLAPAAVEWARARARETESMRKAGYMVTVQCADRAHFSIPTVHLFPDLETAHLWRDWGHVCSNRHTVTEIGTKPTRHEPISIVYQTPTKEAQP